MIELEPASPEPAIAARSFEPRLRESLRRLQGARTVRGLCDIAAQEIRRITGFDRVMVYRFDPAWNGEVVSECRRDGLDALLGADQGFSRHAQGLGLGLALVKRLTELHGGEVRVESGGTNAGATFRVRIPLSDSPLPHAASSAAPTPTPARSLEHVRVLLVEDDRDTRELLAYVFDRFGAVVTAAESAQMALTTLDHAPFDVIVSDIGMPHMDGLQFMRTLRQRPASQGGTTPAVALSAYTCATDRTAALRCGFQSHVPKPIDNDEILTVVASLVGRIH